jgi:hypothetical protein
VLKAAFEEGRLAEKNQRITANADRKTCGEAVF